MATLDWNVKNAINRDVERQHLNKILKDIRESFTDLERKTTGAGSTIGNIKNLVGEMVSGNTEQGISVSYNAGAQVLDFVISSFIINLIGDVTGQGAVINNGNVTIQTTLDPALVGIGEAPVDAFAYWRRTGEWEMVGPNLEQLQQINGPGFPVVDAINGWFIRILEAVAGELVITNPDGVAGNPEFGLADVPDSGNGQLVGIERDTKGRVTGTRPVIAGPGIEIDTSDPSVIVISAPELVFNYITSDGDFYATEDEADLYIGN